KPPVRLASSALAQGRLRRRGTPRAFAKGVPRCARDDIAPLTNPLRRVQWHARPRSIDHSYRLERLSRLAVPFRQTPAALAVALRRGAVEDGHRHVDSVRAYLLDQMFALLDDPILGKKHGDECRALGIRQHF